MTSKTDFARRTIDMTSTLAAVADNIETLTKVYTARDYSSTIVPADLEPLGISLSEFNQILSLMVQFGSFVNGGSVDPADRRAIINKFRTDV